MELNLNDWLLILVDILILESFSTTSLPQTESTTTQNLFNPQEGISYLSCL